MTPQRWQAVKDALAAALARAPSERGPHLDALRAEDHELASEVESLLAHDAEDGFLEQPALPPPPVSLNTVFGPYRLESTLGEGGMGVVYLAQDAVLERPVALKFLSRDLEQQDDARRRFLREAKAAAALDHPYICKIYQTGERDGRPFIAMEYVRGETLRQRLDTAALPLADVLRITMEVTEALETAHAAQIVHRDLKPSNIMLTADGHVKVLDFGLAKRVDANGLEYARTGSALSEAGTVRGTVAYMSPEQVRGQEVTFRSDLFSLGVVLYESLAGINPFVAGSSLETASQILHHAPPPLRTAGAGIPPALDDIVQRLLAKNPDERYQSTAELRRELGQVRDLIERGRGAWDAPENASVRTTADRVRPALRRRLLLGSLAAASLLAAAVSWWWIAVPAGSVGLLSVAVLPFVNVSGDQGSDYLATGIPSALIGRLHKAGVRVISWETSRRFRDSSNPMEVARTLTVDTVLTGSVQTTARGQLRVHVSLADASGFLAWEDEFEQQGELFDVYTRIATRVAASLGHELTREAAAVIARPESSSGRGYDLFLQGTQFLDDGDAEGADIALQWFSEATALDPNLAEAHVGIGAVHLERYWNGWGGGAGNLAEAEKRFETALSRDPTDMRAWRGRMLVAFYRGRGETALQLEREAARAGGNDLETLLARAEAFAINGPSGLAIPLVDRAMTLDPGNEAAAWLKTIALHRTDQFRAAADAATDYARRFGDDPFIGVLGANAQERLQDLAGARERYDRIVGRLMQLPDEPGVATAYDLVALLAAGVFYQHHTDRPDRAVELWRHGLRLTQAALSIDADAVGMRLFLASFLGCLGERAAFETEAAAALALIEPAGLNPWELTYLAGGYAQLGDDARALATLRRVIERGRLTGRAWLTIAAPSLRNTPGMNQVLRAHDAEESRRRRLYDAS